MARWTWSGFWIILLSNHIIRKPNWLPSLPNHDCGNNFSIHFSYSSPFSSSSNWPTPLLTLFVFNGSSIHMIPYSQGAKNRPWSNSSILPPPSFPSLACQSHGSPLQRYLTFLFLAFPSKESLYMNKQIYFFHIYIFHIYDIYNINILLIILYS